MLLDTKPVTIKTKKGEDKTFVLSMFPAIAGREIITQYPTTAMPKIGDYKTNEALMMKVMSYVGVDIGGGNVLPLTTADLINNHTQDFETLMKLEWAMMEYNCSFFQNGGASTFFEVIARKLQALITQMPINLSQPSSPKAKRPSKS